MNKLIARIVRKIREPTEAPGLSIREAGLGFRREMLDVRDSGDVKLGSCSKGSKVGWHRRVHTTPEVHIHTHTSPHTPTDSHIVELRGQRCTPQS